MARPVEAVGAAVAPAGAELKARAPGQHRASGGQRHRHRGQSVSSSVPAITGVVSAVMEHEGTVPVVDTRYRLERRLGAGGQGEAWPAYDVRLRRRVVRKQCTIPAGVSAEERQLLMARAEREARAAGKLKHPGIVTVHDGSSPRPLSGPSLPPLTAASVASTEALWPRTAALPHFWGHFPWRRSLNGRLPRRRAPFPSAQPSGVRRKRRGSRAGRTGPPTSMIESRRKSAPSASAAPGPAARRAKPTHRNGRPFEARPYPG